MVDGALTADALFTKPGEEAKPANIALYEGMRCDDACPFYVPMLILILRRNEGLGRFVGREFGRHAAKAACYK